MTSKRGMSGLIITVLLVAIALSIGTIIIGWITSYSQSTISDAKQEQLLSDACQSLDISVVKIDVNDAPNSSYTGTDTTYSVDVLVENNGDQPLQGIVIKSYPADEDELLATQIESELTKYSRSSYNLNVSQKVGGGDCDSDGDGVSNCYIRDIEIIPMVEINPGTPETHECAHSVMKFSRSDSVVRIQ